MRKDKRWKRMRKKMIDKNLTQITISVAAVDSLAVTLKGNKYGAGLEEELDAIKTNTAEILKKLVGGMEKEQLDYINRYVARSEFAVIPKHNPEADREYVVTSTDVIERLASGVLGECLLCEKSGKMVKRCQIRKDLIACGVAVEC